MGMMIMAARKRATPQSVVERRAAVIEEVEFLLAAGTPGDEAAERLGYGNPEHLHRYLYRLGRGDLAVRLYNTGMDRPAVRRGRIA